MDELNHLIVLNDESGNEYEFEFLDLVSYQEKEYVILLPRDDPDQEVVILEIEYPDDPERESYVNVEDENVLNAVFQIFKEKYEGEIADKDVVDAFSQLFNDLQGEVLE